MSRFDACSRILSELDVRCLTFDVQTRMTNDLSAEEIRALLKLEPHATCGFVRITFISNQRIAPGGLPAPFLDGRPAGSALYFMVTPERSGATSIASATISFITVIWVIRLKFLCCTTNGVSEHAVVGPDLQAGQCVQLLIPGNTFHTARVIGQRRWFLGASTEWPGVEKVDVEIGDVEALAAKYPDVADDLRAFLKVAAMCPRSLVSAPRRKSFQPNREFGSVHGSPELADLETVGQTRDCGIPTQKRS